MNHARIVIVCAVMLAVLPFSYVAQADETADEPLSSSKRSRVVSQLLRELRGQPWYAELLEWWKEQRRSDRRSQGLDDELLRGVREHLEALADTRKQLEGAHGRVVAAKRDLDRMAAAGKDTTRAREELAVRESLVASIADDLEFLGGDTVTLTRKLMRSTRPPFSTTSAKSSRYLVDARPLLDAGMSRAGVLRRLKESVPEARFGFVSDGTAQIALLDPTDMEKQKFLVAFNVLHVELQEAKNRRDVERASLESQIAVVKGSLALLEARHADLKAEAQLLASSDDLTKIAANASALSDNATRIARVQTELGDLQGRIIDADGNTILGAAVEHFVDVKKRKTKSDFHDLTAYAGRRNAAKDAERQRLEDKLAALRDARVAIRKAGMDRHPEIDDKIAQLEERLAGAEAPTQEGDATLQAINALRSEVQRLRNDVRSLRGLVEQLLERRGARR